MFFSPIVNKLEMNQLNVDQFKIYQVCTFIFFHSCTECTFQICCQSIWTQSEKCWSNYNHSLLHIWQFLIIQHWKCLSVLLSISFKINQLEIYYFTVKQFNHFWTYTISFPFSAETAFQFYCQSVKNQSASDWSAWSWTI